MPKFKTLQFPNTARGQSDKIRQLEDHTAQGWRVVSESIIPGKFDTQKAACMWCACGPLCGLLAGHKDDTIQVTLVLSDDAPQIKETQNTPAGTAATYDRARWSALLQFDREIFAASEQIRPLGQKWLDELAASYMVLSDKAYLPNIVDNISNKARIESEEKARLAIEEEERVKAEAARWEEKRIADEAAAEQKRRDREEKAVFMGLSPTELMAVGALIILLVAGAAYAWRTYHGVETIAPAPAPSESSQIATQAVVTPSFDCSKVKSAVLTLICATPDLAALDQQLSSAYKTALTKTASPAPLRVDEREWIKSRNNLGPDVELIRQMYQSRIAALNDISATPSAQPASSAPNSSVSPASPATDSNPPPQADSTPAQPQVSPSPPVQQGHWYYCDTSQAYYPAVKVCSQPWRAVDPMPTPPSGDQRQ